MILKLEHQYNSKSITPYNEVRYWNITSSESLHVSLYNARKIVLIKGNLIGFRFLVPFTIIGSFNQVAQFWIVNRESTRAKTLECIGISQTRLLNVTEDKLNENWTQVHLAYLCSKILVIRKINRLILYLKMSNKFNMDNVFWLKLSIYEKTILYFYT